MNWFNNSKLFDLARQGKRLTHIAAVIPLSIVFTFISQLGIITLIVAMGIMYGFTETGFAMPELPALIAGFWMAMQLITAFGLVYVILWVWLKFFEKRPFW
ncbi:MAG: hypothetical protein JNJ43_18785, partial [Anaerolineales bacterium]|nr:hypothetical protein [Anaerolineales bacterium]